MSLNTQIIRAVGWLSIFKILSQTFSWITTIIVVRILSAKDYGIMEMATVFTGYIDYFVEFGISTAIISKSEIKESEICTIFWFLLFWGILFGGSCLLIAPLTVWYFKNESLSLITSSVGVLFIISSLVILPRSLLHRELKFKEIGAIDTISIFCACIVMLVLAHNNYGVWTLLFGNIARELTRLICLYSIAPFKLKLHFNVTEIQPILKFGLPVVVSNSLFYINNKSDRFFGGRRFGDSKLGFYAIALQLAAMPVEKLLSILQSVIFPAFCKLKDNQAELNQLFLKFNSVIYTLILPLYVGGFLVADQLIPFVLGERWQDSVLPFKYLVISQIFTTIAAPIAILHNARGKPSWNLRVSLVMTPLIVIGFYFSSKLDNIALLAIPWVSIYPLLTIGNLLLTLKTMNIPFAQYCRAVKHPVIATGLMAIFIVGFNSIQPSETLNMLHLLKVITLGSIVYFLYLLAFARNILYQGMRSAFGRY